MSAKVVHFEIPFDDAERATAFYRDVFDWHIQSMPEMQYHIVATGPQADSGMPAEPGYIGGGMMQRQAELPAPVVVLAVDDVDEALAAVESHGGGTVLGRMPVGDMGFAAYFRDPEGNVVGLWQSASDG